SVERRLAALSTGAAATPAARADTVAGLAVDATTEPPTIRTTDEASLARALAQTFSGINDFSPDAWMPADVERLQAAPLAWSTAGVTEVVLFTADDGSVPLADVALVLAFRGPGGFRIIALDYGGYDNTDHGVSESAESTLDGVRAGELLRVDFDTCASSSSQSEITLDEHPDRSCYEDRSYGATCTSHTVLCAPLEASIACTHIARAHRATEAAFAMFWCTDEGGDVEIPEEREALDTSRDYSIDVVVSGDVVTITRASGIVSPHLEARLGTFAVARFVADDPVPAHLRSDRDLAADLAEYRREMNGESDGF
nr:hypothetical protein [Myxococcota bacterium]